MGTGQVACVPVRDGRVRQVFEIGAVFQHDRLRLRGIVGVHLVNPRCPLRGDMGHGSGPDLDVDAQPVSLQGAATGRDDHGVGHARQRLVPVQRLLYQQRRHPVEVGQDAAAVPQLEAEPQVAHLAGHAHRHLLRLAGTPRSQFRRVVKRGDGIPEGVDVCQDHDASLMGTSNSAMSWIRCTSSGIPSPVLQLVKMKGLSPRMNFESRSITSRLAPT